MNGHETRNGGNEKSPKSRATDTKKGLTGGIRYGRIFPH